MRKCKPILPFLQVALVLVFLIKAIVNSKITIKEVRNMSLALKYFCGH